MIALRDKKKKNAYYLSTLFIGLCQINHFASPLHPHPNPFPVEALKRCVL